ncbi:MAG: FCD domain-containing protein [Oscillibacter sp.]
MLEDFLATADADRQVEARIAAECAIAWLAAQKANAASKAQLCEAFTQLDTAGSAELRRTADFRFHTLLADIADNPILSTLSATLMETVSRGDHEAIYRQQNVPARTDDQHWNILVAVCANDPEASERAMKAHMQFIYRSAPLEASGRG